MLYYSGTVLLRLSRRDFWRSTPVFVRLLTNKHFEIAYPSANEQVAKTVEELPFEI